MTWLSEIATRRMTIENILVLKGKIGRGDGEQAIADMERMARVIRELSAYIKASHAVEEACLEFDPVDMGKLSNDRLNAWDNLSPDAKEVLDESPAPSST